MRFLEWYVLDAIGHLGDAQREALVKMEPKLSQLYQSTGSWDEIIAQQVEFPSSFKDQIRKNWMDGVIRAEASGVVVTPDGFAKAVVDANFGRYINKI